MIKIIEQDLKYLQIRTQAQQQQIDNLYISLNEIFDRKVTLETGYRPRINLFNAVRPEVIFQILEFVDIQSFFQFRLINRNCNEIIQQISFNKILQIKNHLQQQQEQLKIYQEEQNLLFQEKNNYSEQFQLGVNELISINKNSLTELKAFSHPPALIGQIVYFLAVLLDPNPNIPLDNWRMNQRVFCCLNQCFNKLKTLNISDISEYQLHELRELDQINEQQLMALSMDFVKILHYLKIILHIRQTRLYQTNHQIFQIQKQMRLQTMLLIKLEKIKG